MVALKSSSETGFVFVRTLNILIAETNEERWLLTATRHDVRRHAPLVGEVSDAVAVVVSEIHAETLRLVLGLEEHNFGVEAELAEDLQRIGEAVFDLLPEHVGLLFVVPELVVDPADDLEG